jgi:hypothetical protein
MQSRLSGDEDDLSDLRGLERVQLDGTVIPSRTHTPSHLEAVLKEGA